MHGDNHQGKVAWKTYARGWVSPGVSLGKLNSTVLWSSVFLGGNNFDTFVWALSILFIYFLAFLIRYSGDPISYDLFILLFIHLFIFNSRLNTLKYSNGFLSTKQTWKTKYEITLGRKTFTFVGMPRNFCI